MKKNLLAILKNEMTWEFLFLGFLFCFYVGWAYLMPINSAPDEFMRYQIADFIYNTGTLPHGGDPSLRNEIWGISYGFSPVLAYMIGALFMKLTSIFITTDPAWLLLAARMVSVFCGLGMAHFTILISKKLFNGKARWLFVAFVTLLPESVFMFTYVNNDSLALFSISVIIYMWICGLESHWDLKYCIGLAIGISICAMSYYNAYGFILCSISLFGISLLFCGEKKWDFPNTLKKGAIVSVIVIALIGWWFIRNYIIYDGDFLGRATSSQYAELYAADGFKPSQNISVRDKGISFIDMLFKPYIHPIGWLQFSAISFVACFGFLNIFLTDKIVYPYLLLLGIGFIGSFVFFNKEYFKFKSVIANKKLLFNWTMFVSGLIPVFLSAWYSFTSDYQPQGRYCLPMLIPFMYFVVRGLGNIITKIFNEKIWNILCVVLSVLVLFVVLYAYKVCIRATYLPAPLINIGF